MIIIIIIKFSGKAACHNDHFMINIGSQRPKIRLAVTDCWGALICSTELLSQTLKPPVAEIACY